MARLPAERIPFFRLSPAQAGQARCFGARLAKGDRLDAAFSHPRYDALESRIDAAGISAPTLGELIESISSGATPSRDNAELYADSGVRFMRILNVVDGEIAENGMKYITDAVHNGELKRSQLAADDVLMTITGRVGSAAVVRDEHLPANINQHIVRMRVNENAVRPEFLSEWLNSESGLALSNRSVSGATRIALDYKAILAMRIPLPPLDEQRRLADAMASARAERKAKLAEADALLSGLDDFVLSALGIAPPRAENRRVFAVRLEDMSRKHLNADYYHPERLAALRALADAANEGELRVEPLDDLAEFARNQIKSPADNYLGLTHIASHTGEPTGSEDVASGACWTYETGDVLFARLGSYLNKVYRAEMDGCCSTEFHVLRVKDAGAVLPDYLAAALRSRLTLAQTVHMMTGNTHPRLTDDDVRALPIPVPPMPTQRRIVAETQRRRAEARRLRGEAEAGWVAAKDGFEVGLLG